MFCCLTLMHADYMMLQSASVSGLQQLLDVCTQTAKDLWTCVSNFMIKSLTVL